MGDAHATASLALGETEHDAMFGAAFTDGRFNYDYGYAFQRRSIDPFDPKYTGMTGKTGITDFPDIR